MNTLQPALPTQRFGRITLETKADKVLFIQVEPGREPGAVMDKPVHPEDSTPRLLGTSARLAQYEQDLLETSAGKSLQSKSASTIFHVNRSWREKTEQALKELANPASTDFKPESPATAEIMGNLASQIPGILERAKENSWVGTVSIIRQNLESQLRQINDGVRKSMEELAQNVLANDEPAKNHLDALLSILAKGKENLKLKPNPISFVIIPD